MVPLNNIMKISEYFWAYAILVLYVFIFYAFSLIGFEEKISITGFTPIFYSYLKVYPDFFINNFQTGTETYNLSLFMWQYPFLLKYFDIPPELHMKVIIFFEYASLAGLFLFMFNKLKIKGSSYLAIFSFAWYVSSSALNISLARYGKPFLMGQFYNFSDILRVIGIFYLIESRLILGFSSLMFSSLMHLALGGVGVIFAFFSNFEMTKEIKKNKKKILTFALMSIGILGWYFLIKYFSGFFSTINEKAWLDLVKMGSYHFFPFSIGIFSTLHEYQFFPHLSFLVIFLHYFNQHNTKIDRLIGYGCIAMVCLSIAGLIISLVSTNRTLITICLHRSNDLLVLFALPYVISGLYRDVCSENYFKNILSIVVFLSPFVCSVSPFSLFPALMIGFSTVSKSWTRQEKLASDYFMLTLFLIILLILSYYVYFGINKSFFSEVYFGKFLVWEIAFSIVLIKALICKTNSISLEKIGMLIFFLISIIGALFWQKNQLLSDDTTKYAQSFLEAQRWAFKHTPQDALFLLDPSLAYAWRDFSKRSSFGTLREWMHVAWLYNASEEIFLEGKSRFDEYDLNINNYFDFFPSLNGMYALDRDVTEIFYSKKKSWFCYMSQKYKIDYLLVKKKQIIGDNHKGLKTSFENDFFCIYSLNKSCKFLVKSAEQ